MNALDHHPFRAVGLALRRCLAAPRALLLSAVACLAGGQVVQLALAALPGAVMRHVGGGPGGLVGWAALGVLAVVLAAVLVAVGAGLAAGLVQGPAGEPPRGLDLRLTPALGTVALAGVVSWAVPTAAAATAFGASMGLSYSEGRPVAAVAVWLLGGTPALLASAALMLSCVGGVALVARGEVGMEPGEDPEHEHRHGREHQHEHQPQLQPQPPPEPEDQPQQERQALARGLGAVALAMELVVARPRLVSRFLGALLTCALPLEAAVLVTGWMASTAQHPAARLALTGARSLLLGLALLWVIVAVHMRLASWINGWPSRYEPGRVMLTDVGAVRANEEER